jgi:hypothetical protein
MKKKIEISETELNRFYQLLESEIGDVKPLITEQNPSSSVYNLKTNPTSYSQSKLNNYKTNDKSSLGVKTGDNIIKGGKTPTITRKKFDVGKCVDEAFILPVEDLLNKGYIPRILKAALGIIGRETSFGKGLRYQTYGSAKNIYNKLGGDTSGGLSQMKPSTAQSVGVTDDITEPYGALKAYYMNLKKLYDEAVKNGYSKNQPSSNLTTGSGDAALDLAMVGYNQGITFVTKYCETTDPKIKGKCKETKTDSGLQINKNKVVQNYLPNYKTNDIHTGNLSSHGYVTEVSGYMKKFNCF